MPAWKVLVTDGLEKIGLEILTAAADVADRNGVSPDALLAEIGAYDALIVRGRTKVTPAVFDAGCKLKVVGRAGVGVDNIDLQAARQHGVKVVNSPSATTVAVAELAMGMLLALVREIPRADEGMKSGKWLKKELEGTELAGKTLGVIGYGRIGQAVARRAEAFGMQVLICDRYRDADGAPQDTCDPQMFDDVITRSDIITIHVPLTKTTRGLVGAQEFARMKDGVYLVDTARGGVIDEESLLTALESGKVAGAALDVFVTEPPGVTPLVGHPRVIATPHIGAQTVEAQQRAAQDIATEVLAALNGEALRWRVA